MKYDLVIFDMDGTLIDSETMAEQVIANTSNMLERPVTVEEASTLFRAKTLKDVYAILESMQPGPLPQAFFDQLADDYLRAVAEELRPTVGAREAIEKILPSVDICLASNGEPESIELSLKAVGFDHFFKNRWFSAKAVPNPKPAPDLFLHAASVLGVHVERSVVVEDSVLGVTAGIAAGMDVIGFSGNDPSSHPHLKALGVPVIQSMDELPSMVLDF